MKVTVNSNQVSKDRPFPKLMILKSTGSIILATRYESTGRPFGTLLTKTELNPIGDVKSWSNEFVDFEGSVTLSND